jgi:hypothetical protein
MNILRIFVFHKESGIYRLTEKTWPRDILDTIVTIYLLSDPGFKSWHWQDIYLFSKRSRLVVEPTQPPTQEITGPFSREHSCQGFTLTTDIHLAPRSRRSGALPPFSMPSLCVQEQLFLYLTWKIISSSSAELVCYLVSWVRKTHKGLLSATLKEL